MRWRAHLALARIAGAPRRLPAGSPSVALTFDDGPDPASTPLVLDLLAAHGVVATFFCVGYRAQQHPELLRRIAAEGHAVGSHSQTHRVGDLPSAETVSDYLAGRRAVEQVLGFEVPLFRPPHGHLDLPTARALRRHGFSTWLWSVDPGDYQPAALPGTVSATVQGSAAGDVILLHDGLEEAADDAPSRSILTESLPAVITALQARGLSLATLA